MITPVSDYMTPAPEVLGPTASSPTRPIVMLELGVRHLPIVRGGRLVGVLSMRDVLDADDSTSATGTGHRSRPQQVLGSCPRRRDTWRIAPGTTTLGRLR